MSAGCFCLRWDISIKVFLFSMNMKRHIFLHLALFGTFNLLNSFQWQSLSIAGKIMRFLDKTKFKDTRIYNPKKKANFIILDISGLKMRKSSHIWWIWRSAQFWLTCLFTHLRFRWEEEYHSNVFMVNKRLQLTAGWLGLAPAPLKLTNEHLMSCLFH